MCDVCAMFGDSDETALDLRKRDFETHLELHSTVTEIVMTFSLPKLKYIIINPYTIKRLRFEMYEEAQHKNEALTASLLGTGLTNTLVARYLPPELYGASFLVAESDQKLSEVLS